MTTPPLDTHADQRVRASFGSFALIRWAATTVTMALCVVVVIGLRSLTRSTEQPAGSPARELEPTT